MSKPGTVVARDDGKTEVHLSAPVQAHGEEVSVLVLRKPTTADVIALSLPFVFVPGSSGMGTEINQTVVAKYMQRLACVPRNTVEALPLADYQLAAGVVLSFFGESNQAAE